MTTKTNVFMFSALPLYDALLDMLACVMVRLRSIGVMKCQKTTDALSTVFHDARTRIKPLPSTKTV